MIAIGVPAERADARGEGESPHGSPTITLNVYAHLFSKTEDETAGVIEAALGGKL
jgi:hypothetical protein